MDRRGRSPSYAAIHPAARRCDPVVEHTFAAGERLDTVTARYLGDPTQFWQIRRDLVLELRLEVVVAPFTSRCRAYRSTPC
jgi:hypothetical protein